MSGESLLTFGASGMSESSGDGHKKRGLGSFHGDSMEFCHGRRGTAMQEVMMQLLGSRSHMGQRDNAMEKPCVGHPGLGLDIVSATVHPRAVPGADNPALQDSHSSRENKTSISLIPFGRGGITESCGVGWKGC